MDCSDTSLNQSAWMEHCNTETPAESEPPAADLAFGKPFAWPDGLEVTVVDARVFSDWDEFEEPDPKAHEFRVRVKLDNESGQAIDLDQVSVPVDGATNGGTADLTIFSKNSAPLEGRLAKGVSAVKTSAHSLEKRYGKDIVVTVQRTTDDDVLAFPRVHRHDQVGGVVGPRQSWVMTRFRQCGLAAMSLMLPLLSPKQPPQLVVSAMGFPPTRGCSGEADGGGTSCGGEHCGSRGSGLLLVGYHNLDHDR